MALRLAAVRFDSPCPELTATFWAGLLGRDAIKEPDGVLVPGDSTQVGLRFVDGTLEKLGRNRLHLHVTSSTVEEQRNIAETALALGGRRRGTGPLPFGRDLYLNDPAGDEFCIIEPGNRYLARCGPLGEVTCNGTPAAGRFWRDALGWALVWDQENQIAIQSPEGGTKISWDDWNDVTMQSRDRQCFDLASNDLASDVDRLVALGASRVTERTGSTMLVDPDGYSIAVRER
jgi:hypothetical protein